MKVRTLYYLDVRDLSPDEKKVHAKETLDEMKASATPVEEVLVIEILGDSYIEQMFVPETSHEAYSMIIDPPAAINNSYVNPGVIPGTVKLQPIYGHTTNVAYSGPNTAAAVPK